MKMKFLVVSRSQTVSPGYGNLTVGGAESAYSWRIVPQCGCRRKSLI